ncbi:hypothetical protein [Mitsuaria sp. GD03876]|uniref:hypothetical protein n=1 Tax=Mitsuaria sp. GD03876 TaxID=2975399 RepID=UPI00244734B2|nr:hypothetical protein [Mitsuaria sp. GD03876]MDH0863349.1 hypothetical protein [Mitsuaria sp. GD03876]
MNRVEQIQAFVGRPVVRYTLFLTLVATCIAVGFVYGDFGVTRFFGVLMMLVAVCFAFVREIPVSIGSARVGAVKGWAKAFICVPLFVCGAYVVVNAEAVTCWSPKRRHLCAASK